MNSEWMATFGMVWLKRTKMCSLIATETFSAVHSIADVLGLNGEYSYEIEVKMTLSDLKKDFEKRKHQAMKIRPECGPNYFYFMVPDFISEKAKKIVKELGEPKYGIIECKFDYNESIWHTPLYSIRPGRKLHNKPPSDNMRRLVQSRMANELLEKRMRHLAVNIGTNILSRFGVGPRKEIVWPEMEQLMEEN